MLNVRSLTASWILSVLCAAAISAQAPEDAYPQDLKKLSIEELTQVQVTSVSRRTERVARTAAAVSVVRADEINRSGTTTLAEALRLADAVDVAQVNGNTWGISTRGFNISTANKLLVLIDGRSTYVPLFGGTFWDVQDALLADIDRIEVIRGPGGTIWGTNAVNGVVNVISKSSLETQGSVVTVMGGTNGRAIASARYGGHLGDSTFRVYAKYRQRGPQLFTSGGSAEDDVATGQGGFRIDSHATAATRWFVSGLAYRGSIGFADREDGRTSGGHVIGRMSRGTRGGGEFTLQAYYDRSSRTIPMQFRGTRDTGEIDAQQAMTRGRHNLVFGSTFRVSDARDTGIAGFLFDPERRTAWTANAFLQDEYELVPQRAFLIAGAKFGRNNYTGVEFQPSVRLRLQGERQMAWGAISRAVRLPTRFDTDLRFVNPLDRTQVGLTGSDDFEGESVLAYEAGYRVMPHPRVSLDAAVFVNDYDNMRSQERQPSGLVILQNMLNARTGGIEVAGVVQAAPFWRVHGSYAWLDKSLSFDEGSRDITGGLAEGNDPSHLFSVRSYMDLPRRTSLDGLFRYVSRRPAPVAPAYAELDLRFGWQARPSWELSLVGQNLLHRSHVEMPSGRTEEFRRAVFVRSVWHF